MVLCLHHKTAKSYFDPLFSEVPLLPPHLSTLLSCSVFLWALSLLPHSLFSDAALTALFPAWNSTVGWLACKCVLTTQNMHAFVSCLFVNSRGVVDAHHRQISFFSTPFLPSNGLSSPRTTHHQNCEPLMVSQQYILQPALLLLF